MQSRLITYYMDQLRVSRLQLRVSRLQLRVNRLQLRVSRLQLRVSRIQLRVNISQSVVYNITVLVIITCLALKIKAYRAQRTLP